MVGACSCFMQLGKRGGNLGMNSDLAQKNATSWWRLKRHFTESFSGELLSSPRIDDVEIVDRWRDRRRRNAYRYISSLFVLILLPFVIHNFYISAMLPAAGTLVLLVLMLLNVLFLSVDREAVLSPFAVLLSSIALVMLALYQGQTFALFLLYPLMAALPVLLKTRWALTLGIVGGTMAAPLVLMQYEYLAAFVIAASLGLSWLVTAWLVFAVTEQSRRLREMAITDPLTGAYNRRYMELQASKSLESWGRYQRPVSLLLLDIDHFKWINDRFGHSVGDEAIQSLVNLVRKRMRKVDILCRFGGEEFVLLLSESDGDQAVDVANELCRAVESANILPEGKMTVSIGVCDVAAAHDSEHWLKLADAAMYLAKLNGRNRAELAVEEVVPDVPSVAGDKGFARLRAPFAQPATNMT
jgi:diguanylate cyclase (GGDEF)-like protein